MPLHPRLITAVAISLATIGLTPTARSLDSSRDGASPAALAAARVAYENATYDVREVLASALRSRGDRAKRAGDSEAVKAVESELRALHAYGVWPVSIESVSVKRRWMKSREAWLGVLGETARDVFAQQNDLAAWNSTIELGRKSAPSGWSRRSGWRSSVGAKHGAMPIDFVGASSREYALEICVERKSGSGGLVLGIPDHDGSRLELVIAEQGIFAPRPSATLRIYVRDGAPLWIDCDGRRSLPAHIRNRDLEWGSTQQLDTRVLVAAGDDSTSVEINALRVKSLGALEDEFFANVRDAEEKQRKDGVLALNATLNGTVKVGTWEGDATARVLALDEKRVVLEIVHGAKIGTRTVTCAFERRSKKLVLVRDGLSVLKKEHPHLQRLTNVSLEAFVSSKDLRISGSWSEDWLNAHKTERLSFVLVPKR